MKKILLLLLFMMGGVFSPSYAQVTAVAKTAQKVTTTATHVKLLPPTPGSFVQPAFIPTVAPVVVPTTPPAAARAQRSWIEQLQRDIKAAQLKKEHTKMVRLAELKASLPNLNEENAKFFDSFEGLEFHEENLPVIPYLAENGVLYRGMGLSVDGKAIRNILENGLLLKDVGPDSNHLTMIYTGGNRGAVRQAANMRFTNLTSNPLTALHYAMRNNVEGNIVVLVKITGQQGYDTIVRVAADIAPEDIEEMIALVSLDGKPTWCQVKLADGKFHLTPYQ